MKVIVFAVVALLYACSAIDQPHYNMKDAPKLFSQFVDRYHKSYTNIEQLTQRYEYFKDNLKSIIEENALSTSAVFDINEFSDLTVEEIWKVHGGFNPSHPP